MIMLTGAPGRGPGRLACLAMHGQQADTEQGEAVLDQALAAYRVALGPRLIAAYALGSLAHGGFSPLVSDVDLGLILADPFRMKDRLTVRTVGNAVRASGSVLHERLSVFWGTPSTLQGRSSRGRFPPLDRLDLLEHGRLLAGTEARQDVARPGRDELLVAGAEFALGHLGGDPGLPERLRPWRGSGRGEDPVAEIRTPSLLVSHGPRRVTKVVLFPVRFLFTAATGRVGTNAQAAEHYLADGRAPAAELIAAALAWRRQPPPGDDATVLLGQQLTPLYLHYIDDHITRLDRAGSHRLAGRFRRWRNRLLA
jgi:hypothetical protein